MRGNRNSDLLGGASSRRNSRDDMSDQLREESGALFEEEYRGSGRYGSQPASEYEDTPDVEPPARGTGSARKRRSYVDDADEGRYGAFLVSDDSRNMEEGPEEAEAAPVRKRRSYEEAIAASGSSREPRELEEKEEDMFDPLPLRFHPQTEGFIPEARAARERLKGRAAADPASRRRPYEDEPEFEEDEEEMVPPSRPSRQRAMYEEEERPAPRRRSERESSYYNEEDEGYAPRTSERRRSRSAITDERMGRSRREKEAAAMPAGRAESGVTCPKCHALNPTGAKFCNGCGANLASVGGKRGYTRRQTPEAEANYESRKQQVVAVYSPKGGVGKSTITKELAYMFANSQDATGRDIKVIVVDVDLEMPDVSTLFRVLPRPNIADWVRDIEADREAGRPLRYEQNEISSEYVVHVHPNLDLLCGTESVTEAHMIKPEHIQTILSALRKCDYDIIMLDCANGVSAKTLKSLMMADTVLWITTMDYTTFEETKRAFKTLGKMQMDMSKVKVLLNNVPKKEREKQYNISDIEGFLGMSIVQGIPYDPNSRLANNAAEALVLGKPTEFTRAIRKVGNEFYPLPEEERAGLFSRFFGRRKD